jgi:hypothetical protein
MLLLGCSPAWQVIRQAEPNPLKNQGSIGVEQVSFKGLVVGGDSEVAYLGGLAEKQRRSWSATKRAMTRSFLERLKSHVVGFSVSQDTQYEKYRIVPAVTRIEPGEAAGQTVQSSRVVMRVSIVDKKGDLLDEIKIEASVSSALSSPSVRGRLQDAAAELGKVLGDYLISRML